MKKKLLLVSLAILMMITNVMGQETTTTIDPTTTIETTTTTTTIETTTTTSTTTTIEPTTTSTTTTTTTTTIPQIQSNTDLDYGTENIQLIEIQEHFRISIPLDNITFTLIDKVNLDRITLNEICYGSSQTFTDSVIFSNPSNLTTCYLKVYREDYGTWSANIITNAYSSNSIVNISTTHIHGNNTVEGIEMNATPSEINITCRIVGGKTICDFPSIITYIPIEMGVSDGNLVYGINFTTSDIRRMFDSYNTTSDRLDQLSATTKAQEGYLFDSNQFFRDYMNRSDLMIGYLNQTVNFMVSQANETVYRNNQIVQDTLKKSQSAESSGFWKGFTAIVVLIIFLGGGFYVYYIKYGRWQF